MRSGRDLEVRGHQRSARLEDIPSEAARSSEGGNAMELRHLRYFIAVAEELHFGRAAERIGIEQSPLSRAIRELEDDLGARLLTRTSRSTRMTRVGETFLADARRILEEVKKARAAARAVAMGLKGHLRIGVSQSIAQPLLARLLVRCRTEEPEVEFQVMDRSARQQVRELREGALDIGLAPLPVDTDGLRSEPLWTAPLAAILPAHHPIANEHHVVLCALLREPRVICHPELCRAWTALPGARIDDIGSRPRHVSAASLPMLLEMVAAGLGVGITLAAQVDTTRRLDVAVRPLDSAAPRLTTHAILRAAPVSDAVTRLLFRARAIS